MEDGPGVNVVLDLTADFEHIDTKLSNRRYRHVFAPTGVLMIGKPKKK